MAAFALADRGPGCIWRAGGFFGGLLAPAAMGGMAAGVGGDRPWPAAGPARTKQPRTQRRHRRPWRHGAHRWDQGRSVRRAVAGATGIRELARRPGPDLPPDLVARHP